MTTTVEFAVQMTCDSCVNKIENSLNGVEGIKTYKINKEEGAVLVESTLPSSSIQEIIESSGRKAVLKGYGGDSGKGDGLCRSAVAMLGGTQGFSINPDIKGIVRFVQTDQNCVVDGTLDGLSPGLHGLYIYQCGDLTEGCQSIGDHFDDGTVLKGNEHGRKHAGDLGNIEAGSDGRAVFRMETPNIKVWDIIGRSVGVTQDSDTSQQSNMCNNEISKRLSCGIISRSAGLFENAKKICACDGVSIWDERDKPLAGPRRQAHL